MKRLFLSCSLLLLSHLVFGTDSALHFTHDAIQDQMTKKIALLTQSAQNAQINHQCLPGSCKSTWQYHDKSVTYHCGVASGAIPANGIKLPPVYEGNYELCKTFAEAHFCRVEVPMMFAPVDLTYADIESFHLNRSMLLPIGRFRYDSCLSKTCLAGDLKHILLGPIKELINETLSLLPLPNNSTDKYKASINTFIVNNIKISCFDEKPFEEFDDFGLVFMSLLIIWLFFVAISTIFRKEEKQSIMSNSQQLFQVFDIRENFRRFATVRESGFSALNGVRFFSMCWIVFCHIILIYAFNEKDPTAVDDMAQSFSVVFIRGGFFAVDTFFLMSGFLAAYKLTLHFEEYSLTAALYFKMIFLRFCRIVPVYWGSVFFFWKVMPALSFFTELPVDYVQEKHCEGSFFPYNVFFINNFLPNFGCAGWSWYLACDFQFFLIAPPIVNYFVWLHQSNVSSNFLLKALPVLVVILAQFCITCYIVSGLPGVEKSAAAVQMNTRYYARPYTRIAPYMVGMGLFFFLHHSRRLALDKVRDLEEDSESAPLLLKPKLKEKPTAEMYQIISLSKLKSFAITSIALLGMLGIISVFYLQFNCTHDEKTCSIFYAQYLYGYLAENKLSKTQTEVLYASCNFLWSLSVATMLYPLLTNKKNDVFGLRKFFSLHYFGLLSKLTFLVYLLHLPIIRLAMDPVELKVFRGYAVLNQTLGIIITVYIISLPLHLIFEVPFANLLRIWF